MDAPPPFFNRVPGALFGPLAGSHAAPCWSLLWTFYTPARRRPRPEPQPLARRAPAAGDLRRDLAPRPRRPFSRSRVEALVDAGERAGLARLRRQLAASDQASAPDVGDGLRLIDTLLRLGAKVEQERW